MIRPWAVLIGLSALSAAGAAQPDPALPHYQPRPIDQPARPYVSAAGEVSVIGYNDMRDCLTALDAAFTAAHPAVSFHLVLEGTRTAPPALAEGISAFAPMGAEFSDQELERFRKVSGGDPVMFRVAHDSLNPQARSAPLAILVHKDNPLTSLTLDQAERIFAHSPDGGQIVRWEQLGLPPGPIHPLGLKGDTALGLFLQRHKFHDRPYLPAFVGYPQSADVVRQVGEDRLAIGFAAMNLATSSVKTLAIVEKAGDPPIVGSAEDLMAGRYPLDRTLYIYAKKPLDPLVRDYLNLVLSFEGQSLIAAGSLGYLPLNKTELAAERTKLD